MPTETVSYTHLDVYKRQDWDRERFTMDEGCSKAVKEVFVNLYNKGLIYQGKSCLLYTSLQRLKEQRKIQKINLFKFYRVKDVEMYRRAGG